MSQFSNLNYEVTKAGINVARLAESKKGESWLNRSNLQKAHFTSASILQGGSVSISKLLTGSEKANATLPRTSGSTFVNILCMLQLNLDALGSLT